MFKLFFANLKMTFRDKQAIFWSLLFPVMFIIIFGLFNFESIGDSKYIVIDRAMTELSEQFVEGFSEIEFLKREEFSGTVDEARELLKQGDIDMVLVIPENFSMPVPSADFNQPQAVPEQIQVHYDEGNLMTNQVALGVVDRFINQMNLQVNQAEELFSYTTESVQSKDIKYIDIIMPGILGMAIMTSAVIGISAGITRYREQKLLKRLSATPLKVRNFLIAEVLSYLALAIIQISLIVLVARLAFDVQVYGNYFLLYGICILGSIIFLNIGFAVAGYAKNVKTADALSQVITMPMMFFSGVFFPIETLPGVVAKVVTFLPLTPMIEALRDVSINAQGIDAIWTQLAWMGGWIIISFILAWKTFRFKD